MLLLREFLKSFIFSKKIRVGFVLCVFPSPYYGKIMASARLRAYDVINNFHNDNNYFLELYKPWKKYDIVIFQKKFDDQAIKLAKKLGNKGVKIVLDINVNHYDKSALKAKEILTYKQITNFSKIADAILTSTEYLESYIKKKFPKKYITCIPENITNIFFQTKEKIAKRKDRLTLLYSGYAIKAKEILNIKNLLQELRKKYDFKILFICEKNPNVHIEGIEDEFMKYKQKIIPQQLLNGDIFIAPRDLENTYNLGHSFTKIGYPMSVGIPVIASAVPSYKDSPALLCYNNKDWGNNLEKIISDIEFREKISKKGINYCNKNFSQQTIKKLYLNFFNKLL